MSNQCRFCGGKIFADASECKHCGKVLKKKENSESGGSLTNLNSWDRSIPSWLMYSVCGFFLFCLILLFVKGCNDSGPREESTTANEKLDVESDSHSHPIEIPFRLTEFNNISVHAIVNEVNDVDLMFHTGNSGICLTESALKGMEKVNFEKSFNSESWGGSTTSKYGTGNSLTIGELHWDDLPIFVDKLSGRETGGKFGPDLFAENVIEINFDSSKLVLHSSLPAVPAGFDKLDCKIQDQMIFVEGSLALGERLLSQDFMIHSGYSGAALLSDAFVAKYQLGDQLKTISVGELKDSFGNLLKTKKILVPSLTLGGTEFSNVPVSIFDGAIGRQKISVLGGDVLRRYNWIFDLKNSQLFFKPNSNFDLEFKQI